MAFTNKEKEIIKILKGGEKLIFNKINLLIDNYKEVTGKEVNSSCPSCVRVVILTLKNFYKMVSFKFKRPSASYKNKKGDRKTISNSTMTDEKAIEFLKTDPKRIVLFSVYPVNWKKLIKGEVETKEEKEKRLVIEAEIIESSKAKKVKKETSKKVDLGQKVVKELIEEGKDSEDALKEVNEGQGELIEEGVENSGVLNEESKEVLKSELKKMSLKDLRAKFPDVRATKIEDFVNKALAL